MEFLAQLYALREWYLQIRLERSRIQNNSELELVLKGAVETIATCMKERVARYNSLAAEWSQPPIDEAALSGNGGGRSMNVSLDWKPELEYDQWIKGISGEERQGLHNWLLDMAQEFKGNICF